MLLAPYKLKTVPIKPLMSYVDKQWFNNVIIQFVLKAYCNTIGVE